MHNAFTSLEIGHTNRGQLSDSNTCGHNYFTCRLKLTISWKYLIRLKARHRLALEAPPTKVNNDALPSNISVSRYIAGGLSTCQSAGGGCE